MNGSNIFSVGIQHILPWHHSAKALFFFLSSLSYLQSSEDPIVCDVHKKFLLSASKVHQTFVEVVVQHRTSSSLCVASQLWKWRRQSCCCCPMLSMYSGFRLFRLDLKSTLLWNSSQNLRLFLITHPSAQHSIGGFGRISGSTDDLLMVIVRRASSKTAFLCASPSYLWNCYETSDVRPIVKFPITTDPLVPYGRHSSKLNGFRIHV